MDFTSFFKWQIPSRAGERAKRAKDAAAELKRVYALVDRRDGMHCRATGVLLVKSVEALPNQAHRHHVTYRSRGGQDTTRNIMLLSREAHDDAHMGRLRIEMLTEDGADGLCAFYRREESGRWDCYKVEKMNAESVTRSHR